MATSVLRPSDTPGRWVCKLYTTWDDGGPDSEGTGFLVNIPRSGKHFIMTAGHNLARYCKPPRPSTAISLASKIKAVFSLKSTDDEKTVVTRAGQGQHFVSDSYRKDPQESNCVNDYGLIAVNENNESIDRGGFAFSLLPSLDELRRARAIMVSGYPVHRSGESGKIQRSQGRILRITGEQIFYDNATKPGVSGGPVWHDTKGEYTAIAIHNYGAGSGENAKERRATRITFEILMTMLRWIDYPLLNVSLELRASARPRLFSGLFLKAGAGLPWSANATFPALGHRGRNKYTDFSFIPIKAPPYEDQDVNDGYHTSHHYAIRSVARDSFGAGQFLTAGKRGADNVVQTFFSNKPATGWNTDFLFAISPVGQLGDVSIYHPEKKSLLRIDSTTIPPADSAVWNCGCLVPETRAVALVPSGAFTVFRIV